MKKIITVFLLIVVMFFILSNKTEEVIIPNSAIRFRVIANSDSKEDQQIKKEVRDTLQKELYTKLIDTKTINEARTLINEDLNNIDKNVQQTLKENNLDLNYNINYGINHFPEKKYKGVTYQEGDYESLVVTLGEGSGKNWWCVLFPPLCLLEAEEEQSDEIEYKSFIKELIDKYF